MTSIANSAVSIQTSSQSVPSTPCWLGEVTLIVQHLRQQGVLDAITQQVCFVRRRFGQYEVIDFLAVLFGYAISGERTLEAFYERLLPFAQPFMSLFDRARLPSRSALSRFLASLTEAATEALRTLFLADLLARHLDKERYTGKLIDRVGNEHVVFDIDGTREAARQRALPQTPELPAPQRRLNKVCAPGYTGRKRGEVVRTRTVVSQAHSYQWLGSFGNRGNGLYREELRRALAAIGGYLEAHHLSSSCALLRLDEQYGAGAVIADLADFPFVMRGKNYSVLDRPEVQSRLHLPADQQFSRSESGLVRQLYDCPDVPVGPEGVCCRVVVATHPAAEKKSRIGHTRKGVVYELFFTHLPPDAFTASDVVGLYLHRGAFEPALAEEDQEQDEGLAGVVMRPPGKKRGKSSVSGSGISAWSWVISLSRLPCAPPRLLPQCKSRRPPRAMASPPPPPPGKQVALLEMPFPSRKSCTLRCPAGQALHQTEQRSEADGSMRLLDAARIGDCRPCRLREQCQWHGRETTKPRRVSVLLHSLHVGTAPLLWQDWSRREHRRACIQLLPSQRVAVRLDPALPPAPEKQAVILSRAQRAHYRLPLLC